MKNSIFLFLFFLLNVSVTSAQKDPTTNTSNLNLSKSNVNRPVSFVNYRPCNFRLCADGLCCIVCKPRPDASEMYYKWDIKKATYTKMATVPEFADAKAQRKTMALDDWQQQVLSGNYIGPCKPPYMCEFMIDAGNNLSYVGTCDASGIAEIKFGVDAKGVPVQEGSKREHTVVIGFACTGGPEKMGKPQKIEVR